MSYIIQDHEATLIRGNKVMTMREGTKQYEAFLDALYEGDLAKAEQVYMDATDVTRFLRSPFSLRDGALFYHETQCPAAISKRVKAMLDHGAKIEPMLRFMTRLLKNPSKNAVDDLYRFLEHNKLPITQEGDFLAYKRVRSDYLDVYSRSFKNHVGARVSVPRNQVDDDRNNTCSHGLHVASLSYLKSYSGDRLMLVRVSPENVVSVPTDYDNSKMRVCEYTVIEELSMELVQAKVDPFTAPVYGEVEEDEDWEDGDDDVRPDHAHYQD